MPQDDWKATLRLEYKLSTFRDWLFRYAMSHAQPRDRPLRGPVGPEGELVPVCPEKRPLDKLPDGASQAEFRIQAIYVPPPRDPDRLQDVELKDDAPGFDAITFHLLVSGPERLLVEARAAPFSGSLRFLAAMLKEILRVCPDAQAEVEDPRERDPSVTVIDEVAEVIELARQRAQGASRDQREADIEPIKAHKPDEGASQYVFRKSGNGWKIAYDGTEFYLSNIFGLGYIHEMLLRPNRSFKPRELEIAVQGSPASEPITPEEREWLDGTTDGGNDYKQVDEDAKRNIEQEVDKWRREKRLAEQRRDQVTVAELERKIEQAENYLAGSLQLGGESRAFVGEPERARQRVQKSIKRAIKKIAEHSEDLAEYLDEHIETGHDLVYRVEPHNEIPWMLHDNA